MPVFGFDLVYWFFIAAEPVKPSLTTGLVNSLVQAVMSAGPYEGGRAFAKQASIV
jgi:hypothetical protein